MKISTDLQTNKKMLSNLKSDDVTIADIKISNSNAVMVFVNDLIDKQAVGDLILRPASKLTGKITEKVLLSSFFSPEQKKVLEFDQALTEILLGSVVLFFDGFDFALCFGLKFFEKRAIAEPPTATVIKGPREGFVESIPVNVSLMRRRLKTPDLKFIFSAVGKYSQTPVAICYIKGIADYKLVRKIQKKLKSIDIDAVLDASYISKFLGERTTSLFKQVGNTEKPDILASKILEGRVAIFVDGSPIALTIPYLLAEDFQSASDYYNSPFSATTARGIRVLSVFLALFLPAFFVSAELFHLQFIPLSFLLTIVNSIKGIPLSPSYEMFFTLMIFEVLNEASVRMPRYVGMVVSIVGGLVLGETAVTAGIISAPTLMIVALSGICLYTVPELEQTFSLLRILFLIIAGSLGGYGLMVAIAGLIIYLVSFENYSTPILAPFAPLIKSDLKDGIYKGFIQEHEFRPQSIKSLNKRRIKLK